MASDLHTEPTSMVDGITIDSFTVIWADIFSYLSAYPRVTHRGRRYSLSPNMFQSNMGTYAKSGIGDGYAFRIYSSFTNPSAELSFLRPIGDILKSRGVPHFVHKDEFGGWTIYIPRVE